MSMGVGEIYLLQPHQLLLTKIFVALNHDIQLHMFNTKKIKEDQKKKTGGDVPKPSTHQCSAPK